MSEKGEVPPRPLRRRVVAGFLLLGAVTLLGFAAPFLPAGITDHLTPFLHAARESAFAPLAAILAYVALATLGAPQIVLIAAIVAAFGPWFGLLYSWTGKVIACAIGFVIGRIGGADFVARHSNESVKKAMALLARRGFWASALIRLAPTVPSVLINIAAGATPIRFRDFIAGTALGSVPKMALLAFGGHAAIVAAQQNKLWAWGALALVIVLWIALGYAAKNWLKDKDAR